VGAIGLAGKVALTFVDKDADLEKICSVCGKQIARAPGGSMTSWIFGRNTCVCSGPRSAVAPASKDAQSTAAGPSLFIEGQGDYPVIGDRYEVLSKIGQGGMGTVYKVRDKKLGKEFAVKVLRLDLARDQEAIKRFEQEAKAAGNLTHPNLVAVYDVGITPAGAPYLVQDYIQGQGLSREIEVRGHLDVRSSLAIFVQICYGIEHAHRNGVIHRDLKPSNILLTKSPAGKDMVKVVDFGIAKVLPIGSGRSAELTQTGEIFGSPLYMSPEQCKGEKVTESSDIYALGCIMYETLTGKNPFAADNTIKVILKQVQETPVSLSSGFKGLEIPASLDSVILRCLEKEPSERYQTVTDLREDLRLVQGGKTVHSRKSVLDNITEVAAAPISAEPKWPIQVIAICVAVVTLALVCAGISAVLIHPPNPVVGSSRDVAGSSHDVARLPDDLAGSSHDVARWPVDLDESSHDVVRSSHVVAGSSHDVAGSAHDNGSLREVAGLAHELKPSDFIASPFDTGKYFAAVPLKQAKGGPWDLEFPPQSLGRISLLPRVAATTEAVPAQGHVHFSRAEPLVFSPNWDAVERPKIFRQFRSDELFELELSQNPTVNDDLFYFFDHLTGLQNLRLDKTETSDVGLAHIAALPSLIDLRVAKTQVTGAGLARMKSIKSLHTLRASYIRDIGKLIVALAGSKSIRAISLRTDNLSDSDMEKLSHLQSLRVLYVGNNRGVTDKGIAYLANLKNLTELDIQNCGITPSCIRYLKLMPQLKMVQVNVPEWSSEERAELRDAIPHCKFYESTIDRIEIGDDAQM
jgi:serine/threonine protein kinase